MAFLLSSARRIVHPYKNFLSQGGNEFLLCKKLAIKNAQGYIFLTKRQLSAFIPFTMAQYVRNDSH